MKSILDTVVRRIENNTQQKLRNKGLSLFSPKMMMGFQNQVTDVFQPNTKISNASYIDYPKFLGLDNNIFIVHNGFIDARRCIHIERYAFVGDRSTVMPNTKIGKECIVSVYSYDQGEFSDFSNIAGNPVKMVRNNRKLDAKSLNKHLELQEKYDNWTK